jgi:hypothetical protein
MRKQLSWVSLCGRCGREACYEGEEDSVEWISVNGGREEGGEEGKSLFCGVTGEGGRGRVGG